MSIEDALNKSAEAHLAHAEALNRHTELLAKILDTGIAMIGPAGNTEAGEKPAKATKPAKDAKAGKTDKADAGKSSGDDDLDLGGDDLDLGGDEPAKTYTKEEVRNLMLKVRDKGGEKKNEAGLKAIFGTLGVKSLAEIKEDDYPKAAGLCEKALAK